MDWMLAFPEVIDEWGYFTGFDIVVGNPPYINMQSLSQMSAIYARLRLPTNDIAKKSLKDRAPLYKTYSSTGDICTLFFERGRDLLREGGYLCFITTNKWLRTSYGADVREYLISRTNPLLLVDFPGLRLFNKATVETCILLLSRNDNRHQMQACVVTEKETPLVKYVHKHLVACDFQGNEDWVIRTQADREILSKVQAVSKPLWKYQVTINFGIKTGNNDVFIVDSSTKAAILADCADDDERSRTEELFKPILKGRDLSRYKIIFQDRWLINTHNGIRDPFIKDSYTIEPVDIEQYPAVRRYLDRHIGEIKDRADQGRTPYNLRNCVYWPEFRQPKIIWGDLADIPKFCLDRDGKYYGDNTTYWLTGKHLAYLLCYLNSPLSVYLFSKLGNTTGAGTIRWQKYKIEQQLVPAITPENEQRIEALYEAYCQDGNASHLNDIYLIIYNSVGLTAEEVAHITSQQQADDNSKL